MATPEQRRATAPRQERVRRGVAIRVFALARTLVAVPLFIVVTLLAAVAVIAASAVRRDSRLVEGIIATWSRIFLALAPVSLRVEGRELVEPGGQYLFAANHQSNFDIPVMFLTAPVPIRFLAKKEVFRIPVLAQAMTAMGIIKTDRGAGGRAHAFINEGVEAAKTRGLSLIVFPEGTRSPDGSIAEFKKGAFRIAIANRLTVVPVTIRGAGEVWRPGAKVFYPGRITVTVHDPIPTAELALTDITPLRNKVQAIIGDSLQS